MGLYLLGRVSACPVLLIGFGRPYALISCHSQPQQAAWGSDHTIELGSDAGAMAAAEFLGKKNCVFVVVGVHHIGLHGFVPFWGRSRPATDGRVRS